MLREAALTLEVCLEGKFTAQVVATGRKRGCQVEKARISKPQGKISVEGAASSPTASSAE